MHLDDLIVGKPLHKSLAQVLGRAQSAYKGYQSCLRSRRDLLTIGVSKTHMYCTDGQYQKDQKAWQNASLGISRILSMKLEMDPANRSQLGFSWEIVMKNLQW